MFLYFVYYLYQDVYEHYNCIYTAHLYNVYIFLFSLINIWIE